MKRVLLLLASLPIALPLAAPPARAAGIIIGLAAAPSSADPHFHQVTTNNALAHHIFGTLISADATLQLHPGLAASWSLDGDRDWTFHLHQGITFHDGTPFTARDVVFSLCRARAGAGPTRSFTALPKAIERIDMPDDHTLRLRTFRPEPDLLALFAGFYIISAASAGATSVDFAAEGNCGAARLPANSDFDSGRMANGTGPYRLARYVSGETIELERFAAYQGPKPHWDRVTMRPVPKTGPRVAALLSGDFDLIENPSMQDLPVLKAKGGFTWTVTPSDRIIFLQPDIGRANSPLVTAKDGRNPLQDARVREAISLAIDRKAIVTRLMDGLALAASQYLPPGMPGEIPDPPARPFDPARARALLAEAGYPDGFALTLSATSDRYINDAAVAQALGQFLTRIGIKVTVDAMTQTMFFPRRTKREFSLSMGGWGSGTTSASLLRGFAVTTDPQRGIGGSNYGAYHSQAFDTPFLAALEDMNETTRTARYAQATRIALADNALIPLYFETTVWAYKDRYTFAGRTDQITDANGLSVKKD